MRADTQATPPAQPQVPVMEADPSAHFLESGYRHLYELNFTEARVDFTAYQKARPDDPLGKASEAASYLFEQFHTRGVLTSEFFVNDATFLGGVSGSRGAEPQSRVRRPRTIRPANKPRNS